MGLTKLEDIWSCTECGELQGRHDLYFERGDNEFCERCYAEYEEQEEKKLAEADCNSKKH